MLIVCPTCATSYQIQLAALGAGRQVRCANCKNAWFATAESVVEEAVMVPAAASGAAPPQPPADGLARAVGDVPDEDIIPPSPAPAPQSDTALTVTEAPPLVPQDHAVVEGDPTKPKFDPGVPDDPETIAARRVRQTYVERKEKRTLLQRLVSLPMLIVVLAAILLSALNWRATVVRQFPQTASLYSAIGLPVNLRGLFFQDVKSTGEVSDGVTVLVIEGTIVNLTTRTLEVPRLRFALRNTAGHEIYAWNALPAKSTLGSGNGLPFRARLASPPVDGRDIIVRFLNRRDVSAGSP
jgi:predicted Zn finger-like uncharacterized protein